MHLGRCLRSALPTGRRHSGSALPLDLSVAVCRTVQEDLFQSCYDLCYFTWILHRIYIYFIRTVLLCCAWSSSLVSFWDGLVNFFVICRPLVTLYHFYMYSALVSSARIVSLREHYYYYSYINFILFKYFDSFTSLLQCNWEFVPTLQIVYVLHGLAPRYLAELLVQNRPHKALRSTSTNKPLVPRTFLKTYGDRAFCHTAPKLWNSLPLHLRLCDSLVSFQAGLKTFVFKRAFGLWNYTDFYVKRFEQTFQDW